MEIKNARIVKTFLGIEDHGIFTCSLTLDYGNSGQGFGGHELKYEKYGIEYLDKILKVLKVRSWEEISGTVCRARADREKVHAIGHILEDQWFEPEKDLA